ncbi:MAG: ECF transporter S component [Eubacterium sp.]
MNLTTKKCCYTALMMAVTFIMISIVKIPIPNGYIHLGDAAVFLCGLILGPVFGTIAAIFGAGAADYFAGFGAYIIPTMLAKGLMAFLTGYFLRGDFNRKKALFIMLLSAAVMVLIYYLSEVFMYGNFISPLINIPFNALQALVGIIISLLLFKPLKQFRLEF